MEHLPCVEGGGTVFLEVSKASKALVVTAQLEKIIY